MRKVGTERLNTLPTLAVGGDLSPEAPAPDSMASLKESISGGRKGSFLRPDSGKGRGEQRWRELVRWR